MSHKWKPCQNSDHIWEGIGKVGKLRCTICGCAGFESTVTNPYSYDECTKQPRFYRCPRCSRPTLKMRELCPNCGTTVPTKPKKPPAPEFSPTQVEILKALEVQGEIYKLPAGWESAIIGLKVKKHVLRRPAVRWELGERGRQALREMEEVENG